MSWISILLYHGLGFCLEEAGRVEDSTFMENTLLTSAMFPRTLMKKHLNYLKFLIIRFLR